MPKKTRAKHSPAFKAKVALEAIKDDVTTAELGRRYKLHANQIYKWKREFVDNAQRVFEHGNEGQEGEVIREPELLQKIGELTVERDFLARGLGRNR